MNTALFTFLGDVSSSREMGEITGRVLAFILFAAGTAKCWEISRRPSANKKSAISLMLVLGGITFSGLIGSLQFSHSLFVQGKVIPAARLFTLGLMLMGLVLAIIGLNEIAAHPHRYTQGRAQSIWSIVLCGLLILSAINQAKKRRSRNFASSNVPANTVTTFEDYNSRLR